MSSKKTSCGCDGNRMETRRTSSIFPDLNRFLHHDEVRDRHGSDSDFEDFSLKKLQKIKSRKHSKRHSHHKKSNY